jgi:hypothetical protein
MNEERTSNPVFYKAMIAIAGFVSAVAFFSALNIFARLVPTFLSGVVWLQFALFLGAIILVRWMTEPLAKFIGGMLIGVLIFAAIGGFWDAAFFGLSEFQFQGFTGLQIAATVACVVTLYVVDVFLKGQKNRE